MKIALVNPPWSFTGSIYFGCREPHLPLEYGYARALLEAAGHEAHIVDAQLFGADFSAVRAEIERIDPGMTVICTAPSYLFWRCAPPELRVPRETVRALEGIGGVKVAIGPHASTTPRATLRKLGVDAVVIGECEEILLELADTPKEAWSSVRSIGYTGGGEMWIQGAPHASDMKTLPALRWPEAYVSRHAHHHHRFDVVPTGPGAELEASRGCPYHCTFCAKNEFRDAYRKRPLPVVLDELDALLAQGVEYVYFIDEIFLPDRTLLEALSARTVLFGVQLRIDTWSPEMLDLLGTSGCVSVEAGVESLTEEGRSLLAKGCKRSTAELTALLVHAKKSVRFVQANLLDAKTDSPAEVAAWRAHLREHGIWANEPVPMFAYPGSPDYVQRFGRPDDIAWERAHSHYLAQFEAMSEIQDHAPVPLPELEREQGG